jgi:hypothetical protein
VSKSCQDCVKSHPHRGRHHIYHYVCAMTSYAHDVCTQKLAILMQESTNGNVTHLHDNTYYLTCDKNEVICTLLLNNTIVTWQMFQISLVASSR